MRESLMYGSVRGTRGNSRPYRDNRLFFIQPYRWFPSDNKAMTIIRLQILVRWHRAGFRLERRLRCWRKLKIDEGESLMALYELRTYTLYVGKMADATKLYQELGFPALKKGSHDKKLVGYFQADTGTITGRQCRVRGTVRIGKVRSRSR